MEHIGAVLARVLEAIIYMRKAKIKNLPEEGEKMKAVSFLDLWKNGQMTEDEYLFLKGKSSANEVVGRIEQISRGSSADVNGVFYALEENRISPGKAMQVIRRFLLTGEVEEYTHATGKTESEELNRELLEALTELFDALPVDMTRDFKLAAIEAKARKVIARAKQVVRDDVAQSYEEVGGVL